MPFDLNVRRYTTATVGPDITTGLKAYWLMNDFVGPGNTAADVINGYNCLFNNNNVDGGLGYAQVGGGERGTITDNSDFDPGSAFTYTGMVSGAGADAISWFAQYDFGNNNRSWSAGSGSTAAGQQTFLRAVISNNGLGSGSGIFKDWTALNNAILDSTNHTFAVRWNSGVLDMFVDGIKQTTFNKANDDAFTSVFNATCPLSIGDLLNNGGSAGVGFVGGHMRRFRFYNVAKTDADILAIHTATVKTAFDPNHSGVGSSYVTISADELRLTGGSSITNGSNAQGINFQTTGVYFASFTAGLITGSGTAAVGSAIFASWNPGLALSGRWLGGDSPVASNSVGYYNDGSVFINAVNVGSLLSWTTGDIIDVWTDVTNGLVAFRKNGGNWNNNVANIPSTGAFSLGGSSAKMTLGAQIGTTGDFITLKPTAPYTYAAPGGSSDW